MRNHEEQIASKCSRISKRSLRKRALVCFCINRLYTVKLIPTSTFTLKYIIFTKYMFCYRVRSMLRKKNSLVKLHNYSKPVYQPRHGFVVRCLHWRYKSNVGTKIFLSIKRNICMPKSSCTYFKIHWLCLHTH